MKTVTRLEFIEGKTVETVNEPRCEKTGLRDFRLGPTQTRLYNHTRFLEDLKFAFMKKKDCTIRLAKPKELITCTVTVQLICVSVFGYAKSRFSHNRAQIKKPPWRSG